MGLTRPTAAQIDSTTEVITDPISLLNNKSNRANVDVGFLFNRDGGISSNVAVFWQENTKQFVFALTSSNAVSRFSNIVVTSNANVVTGNVFAAGYFYSNGTAFTGGAGSSYSNVQVATYLPTYSGTVGASLINSTGNVLATGLSVFGNTAHGLAGAVSGQFHSFVGNLTQTSSGGAVYINTTGNVLLGGNLFVGGGFANIFSPSISTDSALQIVGNVSRGGAGYHDFLRVTSTASGATNVNKHFRLDGTGNLSIINSTYGATILNLTDGGNLSDFKGDVRASPINSQAGSYTALPTDAGKTIVASLVGANITFNASVFAAGDMISVINTSAGSITLVQGTSVTLRLAGSATTGNRTVATNGLATLICSVGGATPTFYCSGAGLT